MVGSKRNPRNMTVFKASKAVGPYGITATPKGEVWYASLAGNYIAKIDLTTGEATIVQPPTPNSRCAAGLDRLKGADLG